ncbi:SubName: Full=Uncharacterized protein {ECO:0000313/EMBL:CCA67354.1} [Serendipita indica DSM 11827]|uniref:ACB domain-containing protein n=1 Tax=Serendipita indica (strain DSM 11827) TaxID=1109443 RepID=G4T7R1_SERID|nr:SubName: Full=Uncharacterized protein {ECO:0000313/EMBL:CCA67354.1} [Serendipita indica DSM 11827]CCA67354.1 hypothetical protein PIIN_01184 [Serendipita indica DSM 11827]
MASKFETAVKIVQELPKDGPVQPSQEDKLKFYALYKTATVGVVNTTRPTGLLDFAGKAKWDAWKAEETTSKEDAEKEYVERLIAILKKTDTEESNALLAQLQ